MPELDLAAGISIQGIGKTYGDLTALKQVDLHIDQGEIFGILGPNGAGKSTLVSILATLKSPTVGQATIFGLDLQKDAKALREHISLTGQSASIDDELTGLENLILVARLRGFGWGAAKRRGQELLAAFDLTPFASKLVRTYSGGMRRKLDLAASLIETPALLFLDEPTTGLDPRSRNQLWDVIRAVRARGTTVILTTQYLEEADKLADRMAVIDHGRVIALGTASELKAKIGSLQLQLQAENPDAIQRAALDQGRTVHQQEAPWLTIGCQDQGDAFEFLQHLRTASLPFQEFRLTSPSLDDVFLNLTGRPAETVDAEVA